MASYERALADVRVVTLGTFVAANIATLVLAELGADVVRIEPRDRPEPLRGYYSPDHGPLTEPSGMPTTALFAGLSRSTRSVSLDMRNEAGREAFRALVTSAHVVVENSGPGQMDAWACSFDDLRSDNPRLVMLSISGYGRTGPLAAYRAYASNIANYLGLTDAWALDGTHFDVVAGLQGACAVVAALGRAAESGAGVWIDLAQTEAGAAIMAPLYLDTLANGRPWAAAPNEVPGSLLSAVVPCAGEDAWLAVDLEDDEDGAVLATFLGVHDGSSTEEALRAWAATRTPLQAAVALQRLGLAAGAVQNSEDLWRDPQLRSRGAFVEIDHPDVGRVEYPRGPGPVTRRGPRLGEHTTEVFKEWLGLELGDVGGVWQAP